jgi:hypothetical protein
MNRNSFRYWVWLIGLFILFAVPTWGASQPSMALLAINNYSGVDKVSGGKLVRLVDEEFAKAVKKQAEIRFIDEEATANLLKNKGLDSYYEAANLCTNRDYSRMTARIGVDQLAILEINGYSEIRREKSKKAFQLLLGLRLIAKDGSETYYSGEGFSEGKPEAAFTNSMTQLLSNCFGVGSTDFNAGNIRSFDAPVLGNRASKVYHLLDTHHGPQESVRENFNSRTEAEQRGYRPCPICFPDYKSFDYADRALEESLGAEGCGTIEYYYRVEQNPQLIAWLERVAAPLFKVSYRKNVDFKFRILDTKEVNAFCSPNGYIYVTKGLIDIVESDSEMAMVIAHEMGHLEKKHAVIRYRQAITAAFLASIFIAVNNNNNNNQAANVLAVVMAELVLRGYSRDQENEADEVAVAHLKQAGLDYRVYHTLMGRFIDMRQAKITAINKIFATHPAPEKRIENLDQFLQSYDKLQAQLDTGF